MNDSAIADHVRIRAVLEDYFSAIDQRDLTFLLTCFTEDAEATYNAGTADARPAQGGAKMCAMLVKRAAIFASSNHSVSNITICIEGDRATSTTFAVVHANGGDHIVVRGLRYDDELVKQGDAWKIARRRHAPLWQHEVAASGIGMPKS